MIEQGRRQMRQARRHKSIQKFSFKATDRTVRALFASFYPHCFPFCEKIEHFGQTFSVLRVPCPRISGIIELRMTSGRVVQRESLEGLVAQLEKEVEGLKERLPAFEEKIYIPEGKKVIEGNEARSKQYALPVGPPEQSTGVRTPDRSLCKSSSHSGSQQSLMSTIRSPGIVDASMAGAGGEDGGYMPACRAYGNRPMHWKKVSVLSSCCIHNYESLLHFQVSKHAGDLPPFL